MVKKKKNMKVNCANTRDFFSQFCVRILIVHDLKSPSRANYRSLWTLCNLRAKRKTIKVALIDCLLIIIYVALRILLNQNAFHGVPATDSILSSNIAEILQGKRINQINASLCNFPLRLSKRFVLSSIECGCIKLIRRLYTLGVRHRNHFF